MAPEKADLSRFSSETSSEGIHQLHLCFFGVDSLVRSDSSNIIQLFAQMYRRFQTDIVAPDRRHSQFTVLTNPDNQWGQPVLIQDREVWPLHNPNLLEGYVYEAILGAILARVHSHFLIHAGVVSWRGGGVVLAADSSHGKTTLVLELVRRGFSFLSDEIAALGRSDRQIHPFPRSLRIRRDTLEVLDFSSKVSEAPQWLGKLLVDIEEIRPGCIGDPVPIKHIIVLRDPAEPIARKSRGEKRELLILIDRLDNPFLDAARQISGVGDIEVSTSQGYPLLRVHSAQRMRVLSEIEALCRKRRVLLLDVIKRVEGKPDFAGPAQLEPLSKTEAVLGLLRRFQGGHKSALLQTECGGSSTRLYLELAELVSEVDCYQLSVGPLQQMADLVCDVMPSWGQEQRL